MLNPDLYRRLQSVYGDVLVSNQDDPGQEIKEPGVVDPITGRYLGDKVIQKGGEEYRVCCPFCGDDHFHLYINYRYGTKDENGNQICLANCFHDCLDDEANRQKLYYDICVNPSGRRMPIRDVKSLKKKVSSGTRPAVRPVNNVIPLELLPEDHIAVQYLKDRGFTREYLANYHLGYCNDENDWMAYDRLIIPIVSRSKCVGWQARAIRDSDKGPKYYTSPNVTLGNYLYNFDVARQCPYVVLTEGVADSWRVGPAGVCLFGKALSSGQQKLLLNNWIGKPVCVMLDRDAEKESQKITKRLSEVHRGPVIFIPVPEGYKDPGDVPHDVLIDHIHSYLGGNHA